MLRVYSQSTKVRLSDQRFFERASSFFYRISLHLSSALLSRGTVFKTLKSSHQIIPKRRNERLGLVLLAPVSEAERALISWKTSPSLSGGFVVIMYANNDAEETTTVKRTH